MHGWIFHYDGDRGNVLVKEIGAFYPIRFLEIFYGDWTGADVSGVQVGWDVPPLGSISKLTYSVAPGSDISFCRVFGVIDPGKNICTVGEKLGRLKVNVDIIFHL